MKEKLIEIVLDNGVLFGIIFILLSIALTIINIQKKGRSFDEHNVASWGAHISGWALIVIIFIFGIYLVDGSI